MICSILRCYIAGVALLFLTLNGCDAGRPSTSDSGHQPPLVKVKPATVFPLRRVVEAIGTTRANESITLTAKVTDTISAIHFDDGAFVEAGAILVELTDTEETALLAEAKAKVLDSRRQLNRLEDLAGKNSVPVSQVDEARALYQAAVARRDAILAQLDDRLVRAPFSGLLGFRRVSIGTLVTPSTEITTLDDISVIKLDFSIPEVILNQVAPGQRIEAGSVAYPDQSFPALVRTVGSRLDPVSRSVVVRAQVSNEKQMLRPGMLMTVNLVTNERTALTVVDTALIRNQKESFVYILDDQHLVHRRLVQTGVYQAGRVEILNGLAEGDVVVVEGTLNLRDGIAVLVAEQAAGFSGSGR